MVDYIYEHFDEFWLLLDASYGTKFHNFVDRLVSMEEEYTWKWMEATGSQMKPEGEVTKRGTLAEDGYIQNGYAGIHYLLLG